LWLPEYFLDYRIVARVFQIELRCTYRKVVE
jgi:hypothetical protein